MAETSFTEFQPSQFLTNEYFISFSPFWFFSFAEKTSSLVLRFALQSVSLPSYFDLLKR